MKTDKRPEIVEGVAEAIALVIAEDEFKELISSINDTLTHTLIGAAAVDSFAEVIKNQPKFLKENLRGALAVAFVAGSVHSAKYDGASLAKGKIS